jgi:Cu/Ag efflux pump CusA
MHAPHRTVGERVAAGGVSPIEETVAGGILSSTLLTLLVLPVLYRMTARDQEPAR